MTKTIWLSFDLGVTGDYPKLYAWLDNHAATECGDNLAVFKYETPDEETLPDTLKNDLESHVTFGARDRVYVIWKNKQGLNKGRFIIGKRKASPWQGYGASEVEDDS
jgi:hypothetical protein